MPRRYICDVLEDMRKQFETRNFSGTLGSIEQLQAMAYRMEAALDDKRTLEQYEEDAANARKEIKSLQQEVDRLRKEISELSKKTKRIRHIYNKETKGGTTDVMGGCCDRHADNMSCDCPMTAEQCANESPEASWEREIEPKGFP